jgi:hypothetical protein
LYCDSINPGLAPGATVWRRSAAATAAEAAPGLVEKDDGTEGLVLGGLGEAAFDGDVGEECGDVRPAEVGGGAPLAVGLPVKAEELVDPACVLGAGGLGEVGETTRPVEAFE